MAIASVLFISSAACAEVIVANNPVVDTVGFFGEASSKIINTAILGELKLEIIFTSQIASCILGSSVPAATPVYAQVAATFEDQNNSTSTSLSDADISGGVLAANAASKLQRRINIQKFTANFTTGDAAGSRVTVGGRFYYADNNVSGMINMTFLELVP